VSVAHPSRLVTREPGAIPAADAVLKLWGDDESGRVNDEIFVSNEKIQQMRFTMPPGARFGHSESFRTNMGADEVYHVRRGTLALANPETGEVHVIEAGEAVAFGRDTWHHGFSRGDEALEVLQYFAPPPATGSSQPYAKTRPYLTQATYVQDQWIGRWPEAAGEAAEGHTMRVLRARDVLWRIEGDEHPILVGVWRSTDELTSGRVELRGGQRSDTRVHGGDLAGYVVEGRLNLFLPDLETPGPGNGWFQMGPGDGFFVPAGVPYRVHDMTEKPVRYLFGVAPRYLPAEASAGGSSGGPSSA
jgi:mannose-6-phosphate isomerase-like protein (cupin superfamily)